MIPAHGYSNEAERANQLKKTFGLHGLYKKYFSVVRVNPYSAGIDFSRQNLASVDVRLWRLKSIPAL